MFSQFFERGHTLCDEFPIIQLLNLYREIVVEMQPTINGCNGDVGNSHVKIR